MRAASAHNDVAAARSVVHGGCVLVARGLVVTRDAGVGSIFAETVGPAITHGAAIDMDAEGSRRIGGSDGSSSKRGIVGHSCSVGTVIASCLRSEFVMAFLVGLGEVKLEVG